MAILLPCIVLQVNFTYTVNISQLLIQHTDGPHTDTHCNVLSIPVVYSVFVRWHRPPWHAVLCGVPSIVLVVQVELVLLLERMRHFNSDVFDVLFFDPDGIMTPYSYGVHSGARESRVHNPPTPPKKFETEIGKASDKCHLNWDDRASFVVWNKVTSTSHSSVCSREHLLSLRCLHDMAISAGRKVTNAS